MPDKPPYTGPERRKWPRIASDTLSRFEAVARRSEDFTQEDVKQLHLIIAAYQGWQVLGRMTKWFVLLLAGISGLIIALSQIKEALKSWLT